MIAGWWLVGEAMASEVAAEAGGVEMVLVDPSGLPWAGLVGATIRLSREGAATVELAPSPAGFVGSGLAPGPWSFEASAPGFPVVRGSVEVPAGSVLRAALVLDPAAGAVEEVVVVARTEVEELLRSARAVSVVDTEEAQARSADLGELMARAQGVGVRRGGGLGSATRFSLDGLTDDQVRFFLDGLPLELAGFPLGVASVPVDLVRRVEVHHGVVPVRLGADALGGAVDLVSEGAPEGFGGSVSYQGGSFDTHRLAAHAYGRARSGPFARALGYLDAARNDYTVDVEVPNELGQLTPATVRRFHDAYSARGGSLELGVADRPGAQLLSMRGFASATTRELQNNVVMTVPYGEARYGVDTLGATARYREPLSEAVEVDAAIGYTATRTWFLDTGTCVYDWFGRCVRERGSPGEIVASGADRVVDDDAGVGRLALAWTGGAHAVTLSVAPTVFSRTGDERLDDGEGRDPLTARRDATQVVGGLEHRLRLFDDLVENLAFVKSYHQAVRSEEPASAGPFGEVERTTDRFGVGDGVRVALGRSARLKASYELATRLPTPEEVFGDAVLVLDNLELQPETSHNANLGAAVGAEGRGGEVRLDVNTFLRDARDLIVLLGNDRTFAYFNVLGARSTGVEGAAGWTSPGGWVALDVNGTWLSLRNTSSEGAFGDFVGDRIPNRPWLYANAAASVGASGVASAEDRLSLDLHSRYVHEFFRGWESVGLVAFKQVVPTQLAHTVAVTYAVTGERARLTGSAEVQNVTDADLYDFFGVQRPGRAVFGKVTVGW